MQGRGCARGELEQGPAQDLVDLLAHVRIGTRGDRRDRASREPLRTTGPHGSILYTYTVLSRAKVSVLGEPPLIPLLGVPFADDILDRAPSVQFRPGAPISSRRGSATWCYFGTS